MLTDLTMISVGNLIVAIASIGLGICGWLAPRWTMRQLDMQTGPSNMAMTEVSSVSGSLFVGLGVGAIMINEPLAWILMGACYGGAAIGRVTSILRDNAGTTQSWTFFGVEAAFAIWLIAFNL